MDTLSQMIYKLQVMELTTAYSLEEASNALFQRFDNIPQNFPGECHFLINNNENMTIKVHEFEIENKQFEKLPSIWMGCELNFDDHFSIPVKKAGGKQKALLRISLL